MSGKMIRALLAAITAMAIGMGAAAQAGMLLVAGSPTYDQATGTGLMNGEMNVAPGSGVNNSGMAVGWSEKYVSGSFAGERAVRWDASGTAATELGTLGTYSDGTADAYAYAVNGVGTVVGCSQKYVGDTYLGAIAVRWDASGTAATELGNLGTDSSGVTNACASAVNAAGTAVGYSEKFVSGIDEGSQAVRWDASDTAATELGNLGTDSSGATYAYAVAVNDAGTAVGYSGEYIGGTSRGERAVRWVSGGTTATELGKLGTDSSGVTTASASAVNSAGTAIGSSEKYVSGIDKGLRAVRWDASGTAATELGNLGTDSNGVTYAYAYAVNDAGTAVGYSCKYVSGTFLGYRAVRWASGGTAATELGNLGTNSSGVTNTYPYAVNDAGTAVGCSQKYVSGSSVGNHAVIWLPDGSVIDLNDLGVVPVPVGGTWTLTSANAIGADGWVAGEGTFDPDGAGPLAAYSRLWVAQVGLGGTWTNASGGTWGRGPNWSTGTPAMQVGSATFNVNSAYAVALDRNELTKTIALSAGTVTINLNGHTLTTESGLTIANGAKLKAAGTIVSNVTSAGVITPGDSPGTLNITGNLASSGTLEFQIGGATAGAGDGHYSQLNLSGDLSFSSGATLSLVPWNSFLPSVGDHFTVLTWSGSLTGSLVVSADPWFDSNGIHFVSQWSSNSLVLTPAISGDGNLDGTVNGADLTTVLSNYNKASGMSWATGDFDHNGTVNGADLTIVLSNYNQHVSLAVAVPEPGSLAMLAGIALAGLPYWRRRFGVRRFIAAFR